jgi:class 3 adenylate cyclase/tetratricopeptide (TPR) repeat protein
VLFCDLVGFTAMSESADPEDVRAVLRPYYDAARSQLERCGGTVEKFIGDAVMAVFGAPVSHEDDAERAVRAGLSILSAVGDLRIGRGARLAVRVGICTGEAVVSLGSRHLEGEGIAAGDVVNTAARLQTAAPVGRILVSDATYRLTRDAIEYLEREPIIAKGKSQPVPVWEVVAARAPSGSSGRRSSAPFVGRAEELRVLQGIFSEVTCRSTPRFVTIVGESGVGKSRLVAELLKDIQHSSPRSMCLEGRCLHYGDGATHSALTEIVKSQAGIRDTDDIATTQQRLSIAVGTAIDDESERAWVMRMLAPLVGLADGAVASREESFKAWTRFLEALADTHPLVLVIDDLHYADDASIAFINYLLENCTGVPLLLLATTRPAAAGEMSASVLGEVRSPTVTLAGLSEHAIVDLVHGLLGGRVLPQGGMASLLRMCGGNPLYAEEFARLMGETDERVPGGSGFASEGHFLAVPETVQAIVAARLNSLDSGDKELLLDAAVVGQVLWSGAVATLARRDEPAVRTRLEQLCRRELLRRIPTSSFEGQAEYRFWHDLVRNVAYNQIPRISKAEKHEATARWLEDVASNRLADHAEVLAHHYGEALELVKAAGMLPRDRLEDALCRASVLAADRARHLDPMVALARYQRALELMPTDDAARPPVLVRAAWAAAAVGQADTAVTAYEEASRASQSRGDGRTAGGAKILLANLYWDLGDTAAAGVQAAEALALLADGGKSEELATTLGFLAFEAWTSGRAGEALRWAERLMSVADALDIDEIRGIALMERGQARLDLDDPLGVEDVRAAVAVTHSSLEEDNTTVHSSWQLVNWQANLAEALWLVTGTAPALVAEQDAQRTAAQRGLVHPSLAIRADGLKLLFDAGRWDELLRDASEVVNAKGSQGTDYWCVVADIYRAHVLLRRGQLTSATRLIQQSLPQAAAIGDLQVQGPALEVAASILLARGRPEEAASRVRELFDLTRTAPSRRALHLPAMVRVCTAVKELTLAEQLVQGPELHLRRHACAHRSAQAMLTEANGADDKALISYQNAAENWLGYGHQLEYGYALLGAGRCAMRLGMADARELLHSAVQAFTTLDAEALAVEAHSWLASSQHSGT